MNQLLKNSSLGPNIDTIFFHERYTTKKAAARLRGINPYNNNNNNKSCIRT